MAWEIVHVPEKPPSSLDPLTVDVFAAMIEPRLANTLVRQLNQICPLENLRHVKRVRRRSMEGKVELAVILCLSLECGSYDESIPADMRKFVTANQLSPFIAKVPKNAATTKEEWEEQCKLWPTSYHPQNNVDCVVGFTEEDSQLIFKNMKSAIRLTRVSHLGCKVVNAAVIVDPLHNQIIATACDGTCLAPSSAIDRSSKSASFIEHTARIGSLNSVVNQQRHNEALVLKPSADDSSQSYTEVSCLYPWEWITKRPSNSGSETNSRENNSWHPLRHAALVAVDNAAARDKLLFPASNSLKDQAIQNDNSPHSFVEIPAKRQKTEISEDNIGEEASANGLPLEAMRPYLCTGFDIYLVWEPCTMCAMALVHQRIRRVFYAFPNRNCGALGSVYRLQGEKSLNHHYSVYRILLREKILHDKEETDSVHCTIPD